MSLLQPAVAFYVDQMAARTLDLSQPAGTKNLAFKGQPVRMIKLSLRSAPTGAGWRRLHGRHRLHGPPEFTPQLARNLFQLRSASRVGLARYMLRTIPP